MLNGGDRVGAMCEWLSLNAHAFSHTHKHTISGPYMSMLFLSARRPTGVRGVKSVCENAYDAYVGVDVCVCVGV